MSEFRVASRYAKSLLDLAVEKRILDAVHTDMNRFLEIEQISPDFVSLIKSPIVGSNKKLSVINALFGTKTSELTRSFFKLVSQKGRESYLPSIAREFHKQYNLHMGIQLAEVTTTFPIDDALRTEFKSIVKEISGKEKVELKEKINENLIGGFVLKIDDKQLDESISSQLRKLKLDFTQNLYEKKY
ncbi:MAG TPA: ATP synthase F1 subunit delta [Lunatimonas sp.]|nr:ATP synthase F1 subunit delta [Lunatimonas sp.]